jgi:glycine betaine/choline ABC-type transport system substrate-binding protein
MDRTKNFACLIALVGATWLCPACSTKPHIVVGSKNFTEQVLLGEILAQQIARRLPVKVERKFDLGGILLTHEALVRGDIDLYPEYTGSALTAVLKQPAIADPAQALATVRSLYASKWKLDWLDPLGFDNTFAMIIHGQEARDQHIVTLSDAARAHAWHLGIGYEFAQRADGLDGLMKAYNLHPAAPPVSMDLGLLYTALENDQVDMIAANSTDGMIAKTDVAVLQDDRHYFPPYQCAVVVREETLARFPELRAALQELSGKLNDATMRQLNAAVDVDHRPVSRVAAEFLRTVAVK